MKKILLAVIDSLFARLKPAHVRAAFYFAIAAVEKHVRKTKNEIDDQLLLPLMAKMREALDESRAE